MLKKGIKIIATTSLFFIIFLPALVSAADGDANPNPALDLLQKTGSGNNGPYQAVSETNSLTVIIGVAISALLGLLGVIFLVLIIYSGFNWMTAQGNEEKVTKAKDTLIRAIIGLIIIVGAYAIFSFVYYRLIFIQ